MGNMVCSCCGIEVVDPKDIKVVASSFAPISHAVCIYCLKDKIENYVDLLITVSINAPDSDLDSWRKYISKDYIPVIEHSYRALKIEDKEFIEDLVAISRTSERDKGDFLLSRGIYRCPSCFEMKRGNSKMVKGFSSIIKQSLFPCIPAHISKLCAVCGDDNGTTNYKTMLDDLLYIWERTPYNTYDNIVDMLNSCFSGDVKDMTLLKFVNTNLHRLGYSREKFLNDIEEYKKVRVSECVEETACSPSVKVQPYILKGEDFRKMLDDETTNFISHIVAEQNIPIVNKITEHPNYKTKDMLEIEFSVNGVVLDLNAFEKFMSVRFAEEIKGLKDNQELVEIKAKKYAENRINNIFGGITDALDEIKGKVEYFNDSISWDYEEKNAEGRSTREILSGMVADRVEKDYWHKIIMDLFEINPVVSPLDGLVIFIRFKGDIRYKMSKAFIRRVIMQVYRSFNIDNMERLSNVIICEDEADNCFKVINIKEWDPVFVERVEKAIKYSLYMSVFCALPTEDELGYLGSDMKDRSIVSDIDAIVLGKVNDQFFIGKYVIYNDIVFKVDDAGLTDDGKTWLLLSHRTGKPDRIVLNYGTIIKVVISDGGR